MSKKEIEAAELRGMAKAFRLAMAPWNVGDSKPQFLPASILIWLREQANQAEEKANKIKPKKNVQR